MIIASSSASSATPVVALSARECDVLRLLVHGRSPTEIARECHLTEKTARQYLRLLCQGVGVKGMRQLVIWAIQNPGTTAGRPARAGLHPSNCQCGSAACLGEALLKAA